MTSEIVTFYRAGGLRKISSGGGDETEDIVVHEVPLDDFDEWTAAALERGAMIDPKILIGLYFAGRLFHEDV